MFLSEPPATSYDLRFSLFGFPVRVHPAFFVMPLILGGSVLRASPISTGVTLLVLIAVFFVSVLVHELGHAFAFRYFGQPSRVVLYWMGGLAIPDSGRGPWMPTKQTLNPQQQIIVSLAGPIFGFLLAALLIGLVLAIGGSIVFEMDGLIPQFIPLIPDSVVAGSSGVAVRMFFGLGIWVNVFLNVLNLAPVYPLDGGQVARQLFVVNDPWNGLKYSIFLSIAVGAVIAVFSLMGGDQFIGIFFGFMAWSNWTTLQQMGGGGFGGRPW